MPGRHVRIARSCATLDAAAAFFIALVSAFDLYSRMSCSKYSSDTNSCGGWPPERVRTRI
jgi:hypothetical protein